MKSVFLWLRIAFKTMLYALKFIKSKDRKILKDWSSYVLSISAVEVKCLGDFPKKPFIIMANHESYYDIFAMFYCCDFDLIWFVKKELFKIPIFGEALRAGNSIAVDRKNARRASFAILKALKNKKEDEVMIIFPQGTRKNKNTFKEGGVLIAKKKGIPIVPVKIEGASNVLAADSWKIYPGRIVVKIFDKIETKEYSLDEIEYILKQKIYNQ